MRACHSTASSDRSAKTAPPQQIAMAKYGSRSITRKEISMRLRLLLFILALPFHLSALAQHMQAAPAAVSEPAQATQFDFLLGQWELDVHPKVSGLAAMIHGTPKLVGTWKAWRAADGLGIEDEMNIVDASGNPLSLNRTQRTYVAAENHWKIHGYDVNRKRDSEAIGTMQDGEMHLSGKFTEGDSTVLTRTRYYAISADSFHMQQDRSSDNGQTWEEGTLTIDAKRTTATATP
jgi:hypothetical protein